MKQVQAIWVIAIADIYPNGDIAVTTTSAAKDLSKASDLLDKLIWSYIKDYGYAVRDEINSPAKSTIVLENISELKQVIITCTKTPLQ